MLAAYGATRRKRPPRPAATDIGRRCRQRAYDFDMDVFHPVVANNGMVATEQSWPRASDIIRNRWQRRGRCRGHWLALAVALPMRATWAVAVS